MALFDGIKKRWNRLVQRSAAPLGGAKELKDIFEIAGVPAWNQFYYMGIFPWKFIYRGFYEPWHLIRMVTTNNPDGKRELARLNIAKAAAQELASLIWTERCQVNVSMTGNTSEDDPLDRFVQSVLCDNNFYTKMGEHIEQSLALGGGALKVWFKPDRNDDGEPLDTGSIQIGYAMADQFVPTAWNNAEVKDAIFVSREAKGGYYYTRLEWHRWNGETYVITNDLYRAEQKNSNQDILGVWMPLAEAYPDLSPETEIKNIGDSLFSYYRPTGANNLDDNSPLGVSIYANAMDTLHALDLAFDGFNSFLKLGKPKIVVPYRALRSVIDPEGRVRHYFDPDDEVFAGLNIDDDSFDIKDMTISLHVDEHVAAINALLNLFCLQAGFSPSTFTFDKDNGIKTATEVISENSKTYKSVKNNQNNIRPCIERLVENIITVATLYNLEFDGKPVAQLAANGYEVAVAFDDSIIQDQQTNLNQGIMLLTNGLLSKKTLLTAPKFGICMTEEEADAELQRIASESATVTANAIDMFRAYGGE